ncbi:MAG TPA: peptidoglycan-binding domain-containing protein [Solirubrobacteraceae bacterium]|nr:peptidoglycan-binding domain-containing protein [Solirubrobacteraceae bacterium]
MTCWRKSRIAAAVLGCAMVATTAFAGVAQAAKPVNMERLLVAAQLDQYRPSNGTTPGAVKSVKRVQRSLKRHNISVAVDGNFGASTMAAYAAWQRRLGYSGIDANGMPGETSLKQLVAPRFTVRHPVRPGERKSYSSVILNARTLNMLRAAAHRIGPNCVFDPTKGSFTGPDSSSEATHAGGGAVDLSVRPGTLCGKRPKGVVRQLRKVGFAAWYRAWPDNHHIHAVAISDPQMATEIAFPGWFDMREQVVGFAQGKDGTNAAVVGPMTHPLTTWEGYKRRH